MEEHSLDLAFRALSDPTRRAIVSRLLAERDGLSVNEIAEPFLTEMSLPAVSKHLRYLEQGGMLIQAKEGRTRRCFVNPQSLQEVDEWVRGHKRFWNNQLNSLERYLEGSKK